MSDDADSTAEPDTSPDPDAEAPENEPPDRPMSTDTIDATAATEQSDDASDDTRDDEPLDLVRYARYALLGGLTLLALVATLRFYFAASNAIDIWVARQYRPLFQAAFNLVVLLVAAVGISWELRKVTS